MAPQSFPALALVIRVVPNLFSLARLLSAPVWVLLMLDGETTVAFWLFFAAGLTDAADGYIAKRFNARTELGAYLDPLADKALLISAFVTLGYLGALAPWIAILAVFRDVLIVGGAMIEHTITQSFKSRPNWVSKFNTLCQIGLIVFVLAQMGLGFSEPGLTSALVVLAGATTVASGAIYMIEWGRRLARFERAR